MGTERPYPSLDDQILACIEAAKTSDEGANLGDFQLRIEATDLVLFNLKTGESSMLYDVDNEPMDQQPEPSSFRTARSSRKAESIASREAAAATVVAHRLAGWIAARQTSASPRAR